MGIFSVLFSHGLSNYRYEKRRHERMHERERQRQAKVVRGLPQTAVTEQRIKSLQKAVGAELMAGAAKRGIKLSPSYTGAGDVFVEHPSQDSPTGKEVIIVPVAGITRWLERAIPRIDQEKGSESKADRMYRLQAERHEAWRNAQIARFAEMRADIESKNLPPEEETKRLEALQRVEYITLKAPPLRFAPPGPLDIYRSE